MATSKTTPKPKTDSQLMRFRASIARGLKGRVNREDNTIERFAVISAGEAESHDTEVDDTTLDQVVQLGNAIPGGAKVRFGHPNASQEGLGTYLGRATKFEKDGPTVRADLRFDETAFDTPNGNLADYVMRLGESAPGSFGASIVFKGRREYRVNEDGTPKIDEDGNQLLPLIRVERLTHVDLVDEAAANEGLFSGTNLELSVEATRIFDRLLDQPEAVDRIHQFLGRFAANRTADGAETDTNKKLNQEPKKEVAMGSDVKTDEVKYTKAELERIVSDRMDASLEKHRAQQAAAVDADRKRCAKITKVANQLGIPDSLAAQARDEGWDVEKSMLSFATHVESKRAKELDAMGDDPAKGVASGEPERTGGTASASFNVDTEKFDEKTWKAAWERDSGLRAEWSDDKERFLAYGENKGRTRVQFSTEDD